MMPKYNFDRIKVLVTSACNSNCTHCFRFRDKNTFTLSPEKLIEIVDFGIINGCRNFSFSGGEFFTHPFAYGLIDYCISKNVNISILTNALELDRDYFGKNDKKDLISFQVSVDGMEYQHDLRRGQGAYKRTIENVEFLYSCGYKIAAKMVLDEHNYTDFLDVIKLPWFYQVLVLPVADFSGNTDLSVVSDGMKMYEETVMLIYKQMATYHTSQYHCNCFPNEIAIKYNGEVFPCTEAREHDEFSMGNITSRSIADVISTYDNSTENKMKCRDIRVESCAQCEFNEICHQGCRLRALHYHGDMNAPDPFTCRVFKNEFLEVPIGLLFWGRNTEHAMK